MKRIGTLHDSTLNDDGKLETKLRVASNIDLEQSTLHMYGHATKAHIEQVNEKDITVIDEIKFDYVSIEPKKPEKAKQ